MATYTLQDTLNAQTYSTQRRNLILLDLLYKKYPHITSHLKCEITQADPEKDYTNKMADWSIMTKIEISETACEQLSCNSATMKGNCDRNQEAHYYRVCLLCFSSHRLVNLCI